MKNCVRFAFNIDIAEQSPLFEEAHVARGIVAQNQHSNRQDKRPACARDDLAHHILADNRLVSALGIFVHITLERGFAAECECRERIHNEVYPQNLDNRQRVCDTDKRADKRDKNCRNVDCELEYDELSD